MCELSLSEMTKMRFHETHGSNLRFSGDMTVANRSRSFANAIAFSSRPLEPNETFLFEIQLQERGWAGHVRCGVTLHNPHTLELPQYLLPDFAQLGKSWVFAIKPSRDMPFGDDFNSAPSIAKYADGYIPRCEGKDCNVNSKLLSSNKLLETPSPTDIGSRIGMYVTDCGDLYFVINGVHFGPCATSVPVWTSSLYAVVDLYGVTKQVRIMQAAVPRLETLCKEILKETMSKVVIDDLPIPGQLKKALVTL